MIWIIIGIILIALRIMWDRDGSNWLANSSETIHGFIICMIWIVIMLNFISMAILWNDIPNVNSRTTKHIQKSEIYSIDLQKDYRVGGSLSGSGAMIFLIGAASITGEMHTDINMTYSFYVKNKLGYKLDSISGNNIYIVNDEEKNPYLEKSISVTTCIETIVPRNNFWFCILTKKDNTIFNSSSTHTEYIRIHVPKNALISKYDVNVK